MPRQLTNKSPAKLLMSRRLRTVLDRLQPLYGPAKPADSHCRHSPFCMDDLVYARSFGGQPLWLPSQVVDVSGPCSYIIELEQGGWWKRHRDQLRARTPASVCRYRVRETEGPSLPQDIPTRPAPPPPQVIDRGTAGSVPRTVDPEQELALNNEH